MPGDHAAPSPAWYEAQYNVRAGIPDHPAILRRWAETSEAALRRPGWTLDIAYGKGASERLDLLSATGAGSSPKPVFVYIHGGFWRALDKRDHAFVAPPFADAGALVASLNYALCPAVDIAHIVQQVSAALAWLWRNAAAYGGDPDRIVVAGHSAGGHLAAMLLACDWRALDPELPPDLVKSALAISGLFELEPLRRTPFLADDLRLTPESAWRWSAVSLPPPRAPLLTVVGEDESEEFHRQAAAIRQAWGPEAVAAAEIEPGCNHMDVILRLADAGSVSQRCALQLLGLRATPRS